VGSPTRVGTWVTAGPRRLEDIGKIAVLRGGGLGDLMFALPAIHALHRAYPEAEIVLLGTDGHQRLLADRPSPVSRVLRLPAATGVHEPQPGAAQDPPAPREFFARAVAEEFDLALQIHGGGRWSNPFLLRLKARFTAGTRTPDADPLDFCLPYRYFQHEALRWLEVAGLIGADTAEINARLEVTASDLQEADSALDGLPRPLVTLHPGATDRRRHWPAEKFADVAAHAAERGYGVAIVGTEDELELAERIAGPAPGRGVRTVAGKLSLSGLVGVLARSAVVVANDSGPRHMAEATGTPTVGVFWCGNMINAGPFWRAAHRAHVGWTVRCPECGADLTTQGQECAHQSSWVAGVAVRAVLDDIDELLATSRRP